MTAGPSTSSLRWLPWSPLLRARHRFLASRSIGPLIAAALAIGAGLAVVGVGAGVPVVAAAILLLIALTPDGSLRRFFVPVGFAGVAVVSDSTLAPAGIGNDASVEVTLVKFVPYLVLGFGTVALLFPTGTARFRLRLPHWLVLGYLAATLVGALRNPEQELFVVRWLQVALPFAAMIAWWRSNGASAVLVQAVVVAAAIHVTSALFLFGQGQGYEGQEAISLLNYERARLGGFVDPVLLAFVAACFGAWAVWRFLEGPLTGVLLLTSVTGASGAAIWLSRGRTGSLAAVAMIVALVVLRGATSQKATSRKAVLVTAGVVAGLAFSATLVTWFVRGAPEELQNLTGRTRLWEAAFGLVKERPVFGWGPGLLRSGAFALQIEAEVGFVGHAHNALLEATLAGGVVGGVLWLSAFAAGGFLLFKRPAQGDGFANLAKSFWVGLLTWGIVEGNLAGFGFSWLLFLGLLAALPPTPRGGGRLLDRGDRG
jgi:O-antigen ligase